MNAIDAEARRARVLQLHAQGLGYGRIAREIGFSRTTVLRILRPDYAERLRRSSREAKQRRTGTCIQCGATTHYAGHGQDVSSLCAPCGAAAGGRIIAEKRQGNGPMQARLRAVLADGPLRYMEIVERLGITTGYAANLLNRSASCGLVVRVSRGLYRLPDQT